MKKQVFFAVVGIILLFFSCPMFVNAHDAAIQTAANQGAESKVTPPPIKEIAPGVFEIGGIRISKKENRVDFPAQVNMASGLIEYLLVGAGGKLHESLLKTAIEPFHLQVALLLLGLEVTATPLREQGDPGTPQGDAVQIWITVKNGEATKKLRIEEWVILKDRSGATTPMTPGDFIFTGSVVHNGAFMAQVEKSIVAIYHDPVAIIDNPAPQGGNDELWHVNPQAVSPAGTDVIVSIYAVPGRDK